MNFNINNTTASNPGLFSSLSTQPGAANTPSSNVQNQVAQTNSPQIGIGGLAAATQSGTIPMFGTLSQSTAGLQSGLTSKPLFGGLGTTSSLGGGTISTSQSPLVASTTAGGFGMSNPTSFGLNIPSSSSAGIGTSGLFGSGVNSQKPFGSIPATSTSATPGTGLGSSFMGSSLGGSSLFGSNKAASTSFGSTLSTSNTLGSTPILSSAGSTSVPNSVTSGFLGTGLGSSNPKGIGLSTSGGIFGAGLGAAAATSSATGFNLSSPIISASNSVSQSKIEGPLGTSGLSTSMSSGPNILSSISSSSVPGLPAISSTSQVLSSVSSFSTNPLKPILGSAGNTGPTTSSIGSALSLQTPATSTQTAVVADTSNLSIKTFRELSENLNKWSSELEEKERLFLQQASKISEWDRILMQNSEELVKLTDGIESAKSQYEIMVKELDVLTQEQNQLQNTLDSADRELVVIPSTEMSEADRQRESIYQFTTFLDTELNRLTDDLKEVIDFVNQKNEICSATSKDGNSSSGIPGGHPANQIVKILNKHMNLLQWISTNTDDLENKLKDLDQKFSAFT